MTPSPCARARNLAYVTGVPHDCPAPRVSTGGTLTLANAQDAEPLPIGLRRMLLRQVPAVVDEMEEAVRSGLPDYMDIAEGMGGFSVRQVIDQTVSCFVSLHDVTRPSPAAVAELIALYE